MRNALRGTGEIVAGIALGIAAMAVVDSAITSPDLQRLVGVALIAVALAGWGLRAIARKVRSANQSINSQAHNLSSRALNWRFRRG